MHKVCITGLGAVGALLGFFASRALSEPVAAIVRRREQAVAVSEKGVRLYGAISGSYKPIVYVGEPGDICEYNIVATKAYDAEKAVRDTMEKTRVFIVACNGLGPLEAAASSGRTALGAVVDYGVTRLSDWEVSVRGVGSVTLGSLSVEPGSAGEIAEVLSRGGARVRVVEDIEPYRWLKLSVNAAINPVTALLRAPNGVILSEPAWSLAREASLEVARVAEARGVRLPEDPVGYLRRVAESTRENKSSMLADVEACRRTEVDYINGAVVRAGEELGLNTPVNRTLYRLVKALEVWSCAR